MATPSTAPVPSQTRHTTLGRLDEEWACLARSPGARQALRRWLLTTPSPAPSLDGILRRRRDPRRSGAVMTALPVGQRTTMWRPARCSTGGPSYSVLRVAGSLKPRLQVAPERL